MVNTGDTPYETQTVIGEMVRLVKDWDPLFFEKIKPFSQNSSFF